MTFLDLFSGIGGFRLGLERCGMRCVGHCEIDKYADRSYRAMFEVREDEWYGADIRKVEAGELPRANIWAFGFPCVDISVSGRQAGITAARSGLFFEVARLLESTPAESRAEWLIVENVKNLLSINRGWDYATVLDTLAALGYDIAYGLFNSCRFGVPQSRERVYIIACRHSGAGGGRKILPVTAGNETSPIQLRGGCQGKRIYDSNGCGITLTSGSGGFGGKSGLYFVDLCRGNPKLTENARCIKARYDSGISNRKGDNSGVFFGCRAVLTPDREKKHQAGRRFKECGEPAFCLNTQDKNGVYLCACDSCDKVLSVKNATKAGYENAHCGDSVNLSFPDSKTRRGRVGKDCAQTLDTSCNQGVVMAGCGYIRKLTPKECWRLQGFPDYLFDRAAAVNSDTQLYRQAGNSVTVNVVEAIGKRIVMLQDEYERNVRNEQYDTV